MTVFLYIVIVILLAINFAQRLRINRLLDQRPYQCYWQRRALELQNQLDELRMAQILQETISDVTQNLIDRT